MKTCPSCQATYPDDSKICAKDGFVLQSSTELSPGTVLRGKYQIISKIGAGAMGDVYKARNAQSGETWAVKVVSPDLGADAEFLARFRSEAMLMNRLDHPNVVRVHDFGEAEDGSSFMVMDYVEGESLEEILRKQGPLDPARVARIGMQVCGALGAAHELGVIHRDVKPGNILMARAADGSEAAKVLDFGIAKVKETSGLKPAAMTAVGFVVGTPTYMSPEQVMGLREDKLDGRSDLYSLGIVLYELLTGRTPFVSKNAMALLTAHMQTKPPDPRSLRADLPARLVEVVLKALEKDPGHRFLNALEMSRTLGEFLKLPAAVVEKPAADARPAMKPAIPAAPEAPTNEAPAKSSVRAVAAAPAKAAPAVSPPLADTVRMPGPGVAFRTPSARGGPTSRSLAAYRKEKSRHRSVPLGETLVRWIVIMIVVATAVTAAYFAWTQFR
jgi:serine/threonine protein kinase